MKALITGSNGLLGTALKKKLGNNHIYHTREDVDLMNPIETHFYIAQCVEDGIDTIIHCAAAVGGLSANLKYGDEFFIRNYEMNHNVLSTAHSLGIKNVVNVLSTCIFPAGGVTYPLTKDQIDNGDPHESNKGYALAKRLSGHETKILGNMSGNNWISIIPPNIYGPNDNFNLEDSHLIAGMIHRAYLAKENNEDFVIWGDGSPLRQFVYSEDLADLIIWAIDNWKSDEYCMLVDEKEYSVLEIAEIIRKSFRIPEDKTLFDTTKPKGQFRKPAASDVSKFNFKSIEEGILETVNWFIKNYKNTRK